MTKYDAPALPVGGPQRYDRIRHMSAPRRPAPVLLLILLATAINGCAMWKERPVKAWQQATGGEHLERLFWNEIKGRNWVELEKHLAPTFVSISPAGRHDRAAALEHLKGIDLTDYVLGEFDIQPNGTDLVVTYTITMRGTHSGRPLPAGPIRMMTVWHQAKRGWMAIAQSVVPPQDQ